MKKIAILFLFAFVMTCVYPATLQAANPAAKAEKAAKKVEKKAEKAEKKAEKAEKKAEKKVETAVKKEKAVATAASSEADAKALAVFNKGTVDEIKQINGISKAKAEGIVASRPKGGYATLEELQKVKVTNKKGEVKDAFLTKAGKVSKSFTTTLEKIRFHFSGKILDFSKITEEELTLLPGVSKPTAKIILEAHAKKPITKIEDLMALKNKNGNPIFATKTGKPKKALLDMQERVNLKGKLEKPAKKTGAKKPAGKKPTDTKPAVEKTDDNEEDDDDDEDEDDDQ